MKPHFYFYTVGIFLAGCLLFLGGCATGYQRAGAIGGGYSERPESAGVYEIDFVGQGRSFEFVKNAAYYHAAEVTFDNQYRYFRVLKAEDMTQTVWVPNGGPVPPSTTTTPAIKLHIQCFSQRPPEACYDAFQYLDMVKVPGTDAPYPVAQRQADKMNGKYNP